MSEVKRFKPVINSAPYRPYAYCEENEDGIYVRIDDYEALKAERDALAAENASMMTLAERNKQKPYGWLVCLPGTNPVFTEIYSNAEHAARVGGFKIKELFTRPAPALDLGDLVPDAKAIRKEAGGYAPVYSLQEQQLFIDGATWLRATTLRNIEDAK